MSLSKTFCRLSLGAGALALLAACATQPEPPKARPEPPPPPAQPAPPPPPPPRAPTAEERQRAEQLANESVLQLQAGDATNGRRLLEQALALDPNNDLARLMMRQITANPVAELGTTSFNYTIKSDDTLAKLAQRFMITAHFRPTGMRRPRSLACPSSESRSGTCTARNFNREFFVSCIFTIGAPVGAHL